MLYCGEWCCAAVGIDDGVVDVPVVVVVVHWIHDDRNGDPLVAVAIAVFWVVAVVVGNTVDTDSTS